MGFSFIFLMKVLLLRLDDSPKTKETLDDTYVRIVNEIKTNAVTMIPPFVYDTEVVDIDAVAYKNDGQIHFSPLQTHTDFEQRFIPVNGKGK